MRTDEPSHDHRWRSCPSQDEGDQRPIRERTRIPTRAPSAARTTGTTSCGRAARVRARAATTSRSARSSGSRSSPTRARSTRPRADLRSADPLAFVDLKPYIDRLAAAEAATGLDDAMVVGTRRRSTAPAACSRRWTSASWAARWARSSARSSPAPATSRSTLDVPLVSRRRLRRRAHAGEHPRADADGEDDVPPSTRCSEAGVPFISVLAHPTTGGVMASFAALGDVDRWPSRAR